MFVRLHPEADSELAESAAWIEKQRAAHGERFIAAYQEARDWLRQYERIGPRVGRRVRSKQILGFPYAIIYVISDDEILILAIAHHSRRPGYWRSRLHP